MNHILVVDDEAEIRSSLEEILREEGYGVASAATAAEAMMLLQDAPYDVVLLDIWLPDRDGLDVLADMHQLAVEMRPEVVIISGHGTIETAVKATKLGAYDFLEKPLSLDRTLIVLKNAVEARRLRTENSGIQAPVQRGLGADRRKRAGEGAAAADPADGADQWAGADLRRVGHRQGTDCARHSRGEPAPGPRVCGVELRGDSRGAH
jgi:DNA-binding NtrC family response regulator